jgi:hypothetical protein
MPRRPYPRLIAVTALAAVSAVVLLVLISAPVAPGCFEYCEVSQDLAVIGLRLVAVAWLVVWLRAASDWRTRESTVAAVSAVVAGALLLGVAVTELAVEPFGGWTAELEQIALVLALGLQLPPVWRLTRRTRPSPPLRVLGWLMAAAVMIAILVCLFLGANIYGSGRNIVFFAWAGFVACLLVIAVLAYRDGAAPRSVAGPLIAACLPILLLPVAYAAPGDLGIVVFMAMPLTGLAWLWVAFTWLRTDLRAGPPTAEVAAGATDAAAAPSTAAQDSI